MTRTRGFELTTEAAKENEQNTQEPRYRLPERATAHSAGYDFFAPADFILPVGEVTKVVTGVKAYMQEGEVLQLYPRSSVGKKGVVLANTVGIIDSDYYNNPDNEGVIIAMLKNTTNSPISFAKGDRFIQGVFVPFLKADCDNNDNQATNPTKRSGGIGSTGV